MPKNKKPITIKGQVTPGKLLSKSSPGSKFVGGKKSSGLFKFPKLFK